METKIIKDFLEPEQFKDIKEMFYLPTFPWYLNKILHENEERQFTHSFFLKQKRNSDFFPFLRPFLKKLNMFILVKAKANLLFQTDTIIEHGFHKDFNSTKNKKINTGIFYINTNNGYTKFKNNKKIESKENTFIEFNSNKMHTGSSCTNEKKKIVLNFNYIK